VVNARDAMPEGGSITVSAENVTLRGTETVDSLKGEFVALTISDTGSGIPAEVLSKIFEPFFTTKSPDKGTGLGLSQAYGFVQQSGGGIAVRSQVGQGTRSRFICRAAMPPSRPSFPKRPPSRMAKARPSLLSRTIRM